MTISHREYQRLIGRPPDPFEKRLSTLRSKIPERHTRKCVICRRKDRDAIDLSFLMWRSPASIAQSRGIPAQTRNIYRHARATGLYAFRRLEFLRAAETVIENSLPDSRHPNSYAVIRAAKLCAGFDVNGEPIRHARLRAARAHAPSSAHASKNESAAAAGTPQPSPPATGPRSVAIEIAPAVDLLVNQRGIRVRGNRQFLVKLKSSAND
jgi:hypothetical protein